MRGKTGRLAAGQEVTALNARIVLVSEAVSKGSVLAATCDKTCLAEQPQHSARDVRLGRLANRRATKGTALAQPSKCKRVFVCSWWRGVRNVCTPTTA